LSGVEVPEPWCAGVEAPEAEAWRYEGWRWTDGERGGRCWCPAGVWAPLVGVLGVSGAIVCGRPGDPGVLPRSGRVSSAYDVDLRSPMRGNWNLCSDV
jgi:hypothetical protein